MIDRSALRLSAALLLAGQLLYIVVTQFHVGGHANHHASIFAKYAESGIWKGVHVGQFVAAAILLSGLVALVLSLDLQDGPARWAGRFGAASAVVAIALYAVLQAVDGVGNQEVEDAWMSASGSEKAAYFASAEAMRWLEWGVRSYLDYAIGLALVLVAVAVAKTEIPRLVAHLMGLSGLVYLGQGWVVGAEGFSHTHDLLIISAWLFSLPWMIWLAVLARRRVEASDRRLLAT
jgi:hypothetical protein